MKRKTPEGRTTQTLDTGAAIAVASVLRKCLSWRDRCGRAYKIERKIEKRADQAIVKVTRFDRLACKALAAVMGPVAGTDHAIVAIEASVPMHETHFTIVRVGSGAQAPSAPRNVEYTGTLSNVMPCDAEGCRAAASAVWSAAGADALGSITVARKASHYEISLTDVARVSHEGCIALAPWADSYIDFDTRRLVCIVDRAYPEL